MTKAIEHIVAGYFTLKNRTALEQIREEIDVVNAALDKLQS